MKRKVSRKPKKKAKSSKKDIPLNDDKSEYNSNISEIINNPLYSLIINIFIGIALPFVILISENGDSVGVIAFLLVISMFLWVPYIAVFPGVFIRYIHTNENWYWNEVGKPPRWFWGRSHQGLLIRCLQNKDYNRFNKVGFFVRIAPVIRIMHTIAATTLTISISAMCGLYFWEVVVGI